jgi:hypothetical protein
MKAFLGNEMVIRDNMKKVTNFLVDCSCLRWLSGSYPESDQLSGRLFVSQVTVPRTQKVTKFSVDCSCLGWLSASYPESDQLSGWLFVSQVTKWLVPRKWPTFQLTVRVSGD